jgi:hypothetical protein
LPAPPAPLSTVRRWFFGPASGLTIFLAWGSVVTVLLLGVYVLTRDEGGSGSLAGGESISAIGLRIDTPAGWGTLRVDESTLEISGRSGEARVAMRIQRFDGEGDTAAPSSTGRLEVQRVGEATETSIDRRPGVAITYETAAGGAPTTTRDIVIKVRRGVAYYVSLSAPTPAWPSALPLFEASLRSIRFE